MKLDNVNKLLEKLSKKTGREWTFADLLKLAEKLPRLRDEGEEAVFSELSQLGLELSEDQKKRIAGKVLPKEQTDAPFNEIEETYLPDIKPKKRQKQGKASKKRKTSLAQKDLLRKIAANRGKQKKSKKANM